MLDFFMLWYIVLQPKYYLYFENVAKDINFLLFDLFPLVVAGEKLPSKPNCKIHKVFSKTFHINQISKLYLNYRLRYSLLLGWLLWR